MELPFRIEKKESFRVAGYSIQTTNKKGEGRKAVPAFWEQFRENSKENVLMNLMNQEPFGLFGISVYNTDPGDKRKFEYFIAVSSDADLEDGFSEYMVPSATWAVFPCTVETIGKTEMEAITKWLPKSSYKPLNAGYITGRMKSGAPDIEYYGKDGSVEVWIAVSEK